MVFLYWMRAESITELHSRPVPVTTRVKQFEAERREEFPFHACGNGFLFFLWTLLCVK
jgi:hypothetical protein